ncbi:phasin family protein [Hyphomicrobium sp. CS1GBMeth3]|uniref:phasin family protein n=1 Tax=Hyphomicrobium sp. CS1GBMeth3 TaxID=1892845 RepID=UPI000931A377|nr:phasin family protein [Hyphomicrobium sp. CS1GBMeth3]
MGTGYQPEFDSKAFGPFGPLFQTYANAFESFGRAYGIANPLSGEAAPQDFTQRLSGPMKAAARSQLEWLGLINRRAQAYMQAPGRLAHCRTPHDLVNEQMAFWRTAAEQYSDSYRKIFEAWASPDVGINGRTAAAQRDYINFNGTASREADARETRQETGGRQRRVA